MDTMRIVVDAKFIQLSRRVERTPEECSVEQLPPGGRTKPDIIRRLSLGIPELDKMLGGSIREGDSLLVAGPSGTGKSALATQFIAEGLRQGEPGIMAIFEERPEGYIQRAGEFGLRLRAAEQKGTL